MAGAWTFRRIMIAAAAVVLVGSLAYAAAAPAPSPATPAKTGAAKPEKAGVHGGPKARFHDRAVCNLTDVSKLTGNWTHGDYMAAVAKSGDETKIRAAARSRCGKPVHAGGSKGAARAAKRK